MKTRRKKSERRRLSRSSRHRSWQVQEAKAKFSQLLDETISLGYQTITRNGTPVAYLVSKEEFDRHLHPKKSFLEALDRCPFSEVDLEIDRQQDSIRDIDL